MSESRAMSEARQNSLNKPMPFVVDLKAEFFDRYVKPHHWKQERSRYWVVLFYASWCLTCEEFVEPLRELAIRINDQPRVDGDKLNALRRKISIGKHDVTYGEVIADKYNVEGYPTLLLFDRDNDAKVTKFEGVPTVENLIDFVNRNTNLRVD